MSKAHESSAWRTLSAKLRKQYNAQLPMRCVQPRCSMGGYVYPGQKFDVGHIRDVALGGALLDPMNCGPSHRYCNRKDGGTAGARKTNAQRAQKNKEQGRWMTW